MQKSRGESVDDKKYREKLLKVLICFWFEIILINSVLFGFEIDDYILMIYD